METMAWVFDGVAWFCAAFVVTLSILHVADWVRAKVWAWRRRKVAREVNAAVIEAFKAAGFQQVPGPHGVTLLRSRVLVVPDRYRDEWMDEAKAEARALCRDIEEGRG